jgi:hypothetical protein
MDFEPQYIPHNQEYLYDMINPISGSLVLCLVKVHFNLSI